MGSLNKVQIIGNLGKEPEVRAVTSGAKVCNFPVATTESYTDRNGQKVDKTEWHNIVMWRGLAEVAEKYLHKGSQVYIEGRMQTRSWDDQNGQKRYITEIVAENLVMLGRPRGDGDGNYSRENSGKSEGSAGNRGSSEGGYADRSGGLSGGASGGSSYNRGGAEGSYAPATAQSSSSAGSPPAPEDDLPF